MQHWTPEIPLFTKHPLDHKDDKWHDTMILNYHTKKIESFFLFCCSCGGGDRKEWKREWMQPYCLTAWKLIWICNIFLLNTQVEHQKQSRFILNRAFRSKSVQTLSFNLLTARQFFKVTFSSNDRGLHPGTLTSTPFQQPEPKSNPLLIL